MRGDGRLPAIWVGAACVERLRDSGSASEFSLPGGNDAALETAFDVSVLIPPPGVYNIEDREGVGEELSSALIDGTGGRINDVSGDRCVRCEGSGGRGGEDGANVGCASSSIGRSPH